VEVPDGGFGGTFTELNRVYLKTNKTAGVLFFQNAAEFNLATPADCRDSDGNATICPPTDAPVQIYAFVPHIYYIRNFSHSEGDGIPALARRALISTAGAAPTMQEELLAPGVENLQIEWGVDSNDDLQIDAYTSTPTEQQLAFGVQTARIHLLVRASSPGSALTQDAKTFQLGNADPQELRGVLRRSFTATVALRNLAP
jgi:type IV pilus assembly protein PilW